MLSQSLTYCPSNSIQHVNIRHVNIGKLQVGIDSLVLCATTFCFLSRRQNVRRGSESIPPRGQERANHPPLQTHRRCHVRLQRLAGGGGTPLLPLRVPRGVHEGQGTPQPAHGGGGAVRLRPLRCLLDWADGAVQKIHTTR